MVSSLPTQDLHSSFKIPARPFPLSFCTFLHQCLALLFKLSPCSIWPTPYQHKAVTSLSGSVPCQTLIYLLSTPPNKFIFFPFHLPVSYDLFHVNKSPSLHSFPELSQIVLSVLSPISQASVFLPSRQLPALYGFFPASTNLSLHPLIPFTSSLSHFTPPFYSLVISTFPSPVASLSPHIISVPCHALSLPLPVLHAFLLHAPCQPLPCRFSTLPGQFQFYVPSWNWLH